MPICFLLGMSDNQAPSLNLKLHPRKLGDWKRSSKLAQLHWRSRPIASYKMQQGRGQLHLQQIGDNQSGEMVCLWKLGKFLARKAWLSSGWCQQSVKHRQQCEESKSPRQWGAVDCRSSAPSWCSAVLINLHSVHPCRLELEMSSSIHIVLSWKRRASPLPLRELKTLNRSIGSWRYFRSSTVYAHPFVRVATLYSKIHRSMPQKKVT